jgi:hypothetical protein
MKEIELDCTVDIIERMDVAMSAPVPNSARPLLMLLARLDKVGQLPKQEAAAFLGLTVAAVRRQADVLREKGVLGIWDSNGDYALLLDHLEPHAMFCDPPTDPVRASESYRNLLDKGLSDIAAYEAAKYILEHVPTQGVQKKSAAPDRPIPPLIRATPPEETTAPDNTADEMLETLAGILGLPIVGPADPQAWQQLMDQENKHSTAGEVPAFDLLYPAILDAANDAVRAGNVPDTLAEFIDPAAARLMRAPWDDPRVAAEDEGALWVEITRMLNDIDRCNNPNIKMPQRVTETGDDGEKRTERLSAYHKRVSAMWRQAQRWAEIEAYEPE